MHSNLPGVFRIVSQSRTILNRRSCTSVVSNVFHQFQITSQKKCKGFSYNDHEALLKDHVAKSSGKSMCVYKKSLTCSAKCSGTPSCINYMCRQIGKIESFNSLGVNFKEIENVIQLNKRQICQIYTLKWKLFSIFAGREFCTHS